MIRSYRYFTSAFVLALALPLSGCISLLPSAGPAPTLMQPAPNLGPSNLKSSKVLHIEEPTAAMMYDGTKVAIRKTAETGLESYTYLEGNEWAERLPKMLQRQLVAHFKTAEWPGVIGEAKVLHPDYKLMLEVRKFQINLGQGIEVSINATLVDTKNFTAISSKTFDYVVASENTVSSYKKAFDQALGQFMKDCEKLLQQGMSLSGNS